MAVVIERIKNQFGEEIEAHTIEYAGNGKWVEWEITCYSSSHFGLGTCRCINHEPAESWEVGPSRVLQILEHKPELASQFSEEELIILREYKENLQFKLFTDLEEHFGMPNSELEKNFGVCYQLGINPLPRLRSVLKELGYNDIQVVYAINEPGICCEADEKPILVVWHDPEEHAVEFELIEPEPESESDNHSSMIEPVESDDIEEV